MDNLEKYLHEKRDEIDRTEAVPEEAMWEAISSKIETAPAVAKRVRLWQRLAIAASVAALAGWGILLLKPEPAKPVSIADISPKMAEEEVQLQQLISQKEKEINWEELDKSLFQDIVKDLQAIDENSEQIKSDISSFPDNGRAVETLLRQYELKIRILENLKREIEKNKSYEELEKSI